MSPSRNRCRTAAAHPAASLKTASFPGISTRHCLFSPTPSLLRSDSLSEVEAQTLTRESLSLNNELKAVILAHNYQVPESQDLADFAGDSLGLAQQADATDSEVIVFCGGHSMAETAKILNPDKLVILPDRNAGCSLEESCPAAALRELQKSDPNFYTIAYVNCSAVICTSGNAVKIVEAAPADRVQMPTDGCRCSECRYMKLNTLEKLRDCMKRLSPPIELSGEIVECGRLPIERMLTISARKTEIS